MIHGATFLAMLPGNNITGSVRPDWMSMKICLKVTEGLQERKSDPISVGMPEKQYLKSMVLASEVWEVFFARRQPSLVKETTVGNGTEVSGEEMGEAEVVVLR